MCWCCWLTCPSYLVQASGFIKPRGLFALSQLPTFFAFDRQLGYEYPPLARALQSHLLGAGITQLGELGKLELEQEKFEAAQPIPIAVRGPVAWYLRSWYDKPLLRRCFVPQETVCLSTSPGVLLLRGKDKAALERDYTRCRELEQGYGTGLYDYTRPVRMQSMPAELELR
jgi:hypothetical protein